MRPLLADGDMIPVFPVEQGRIGPGDVVLYERAGGRHLHRVWWRRRETLWMKDDAGLVPLHRIDVRQVLGDCREHPFLCRGWIGWAYGLGATLVFTSGRRLKRLFGARATDPVCPSHHAA